MRGERAGAPRVLTAFAAALAAAGAVRAQAPTAEALVIVNANVVDVTNGTVRAASVVLRDRRIAAIGGRPPSGAKTLDAAGRYVVPGLIDAHVHLENLRALRLALESGATTARSAGVSHYADVGLRELVRQGIAAGPDVVAAGYHVRPSLAEGAFLDHPDLAVFFKGVNTADAVRRVARANASRRVDWIKVM